MTLLNSLIQGNRAIIDRFDRSQVLLTGEFLQARNKMFGVLFSQQYQLLLLSSSLKRKHKYKEISDRTRNEKNYTAEIQRNLASKLFLIAASTQESNAVILI